MSPNSCGVRNLEGAPEDALEQGLDGLARAAGEFGAKTLAVLVLEATSLEIVYCRPAPGDVRAAAAAIARGLEVHKALANGSGPVPAESPVARFLNAAVAPAANSFLLFPWQARRRVVTTVFGFAERRPVHASVPEHLTESLHLAALAAWSLREVDHLRTELRVVNERFAGRKLVER